MKSCRRRYAGDSDDCVGGRTESREGEVRSRPGIIGASHSVEIHLIKAVNFHAVNMISLPFPLDNQFARTSNTLLIVGLAEFVLGVNVEAMNDGVFVIRLKT